MSFPDSLKTIGQYAFYSCNNLESVVLPAGIETLGVEAFADCGLTFAEFGGDAPDMGNRVFGDTGLNNTVIYYHTGKTSWTSPLWNGYSAAPIEPFTDYSALDADNRNAQGILFTLNETAKTATVGNGSGDSNNAGYYGAQKGAVVIPDTVTKDGVAYQVIGIGPNAFSLNKHISSVSIGSGVASVIPSAEEIIGDSQEVCW